MGHEGSYGRFHPLDAVVGAVWVGWVWWSVPDVWILPILCTGANRVRVYFTSTFHLVRNVKRCKRFCTPMGANTGSILPGHLAYMRSPCLSFRTLRHTLTGSQCGAHSPSPTACFPPRDGTLAEHPGGNFVTLRSRSTLLAVRENQTQKPAPKNTQRPSSALYALLYASVGMVPPSP
jgi:hypothetical protein